MRVSKSELLLKSLSSFPENIVFMFFGALILVFPVIATTGQFMSTGYFSKTVPVLLFYWPGSDVDLRMNFIVWLVMGLMFASYFAGIAYMFYRRTLGKVILLTIIIFIFSGLLRNLLAHTLGMQENPMPDLTGKANSAILSLWHNPIWEEIAFRGIPLVILLSVEKYLTKKRTMTGVLLYILIPSIICGIYHIPGHGLIRFFDTLIIGAGFAWLALKYSFLAPVVMHYIADAMQVMNLNKIPTIQPSEVPWIIKYGASINTFSSVTTLILIALVPVLMIFYFLKYRRASKEKI